jgi:nicotinate-nucleotide adenylyltransferase
LGGAAQPLATAMDALQGTVGAEATPLTEPDPFAAAPVRRIGVLGGTFDPPHLGHLWLATLAADAAGLDRVLFMPAGQPPHKRGQPMSAAADRLLMTRLAIAGDPRLELTPIEIERPGPSFTIDSIGQLREMYGEGTRLFLVMAVDSLLQIDTWHQPDALLGLVDWLVGPRPGFPAPSPAALGERFGDRADRIRLLSGPSLDVSSSQIRARVAAGGAIRYLVPRAVEELIQDRRLFRGGAPGIEAS